MNENSPHRLLRDRVAALEAILASDGLVSTMRTVALLLELVGDLTDRVAELDGGAGIDRAYAEKLAERAAAAVKALPDVEAIQ